MRYVKQKRTGRRKCPFTTADGAPRPAFVDYKDVTTLKRFVTAQGKLRSRKQTGASAAYQRALAAAVKRARFMGLMPYVAE